MAQLKATASDVDLILRWLSELPARAVVSIQARLPRRYQRPPGVTPRRFLSQADMDYIREHYEAGEPKEAIAAALGIKPGTVGAYASRMGLRGRPLGRRPKEITDDPATSAYKSAEANGVGKSTIYRRRHLWRRPIQQPSLPPIDRATEEQMIADWLDRNGGHGNEWKWE